MRLNLSSMGTDEEFVVSAEDGAMAVVSRHGSHVCRWHTADGIERLYLSPVSRSRDAPIRGGIPIVFPQFADRGPLPKHGFARTLPWEVGAVRRLSDGKGRLTLSLRDSPTTIALWPYEFRLEVSITVGGGALDVDLQVCNSGRTPFAFSSALHTYLRTWAAAPHILGLQGLQFMDGREGGRGKTAPDAPLAIDHAIEHYYSVVTSPISLVQGHSTVTMTQYGFTETVIWNPGQQTPEAFPDLPHDGHRHFVCIESALIDCPVQLEAGECWLGGQRLEVDA